MQMLSGKHVGLPRHATSSSGRTPRPFSGAQGLPSARRKLARAPFAAASGVATTFEFGTGSLQGLRDTMEDQVVAVEDAKLGCIFAAVFDGHGGAYVAEWLAANLPAILSSSLTAGELAGSSQGDVISASARTVVPQPLAGKLQALYEKVDKDIMKHLEGLKQPSLLEVGSTASTAFVLPDRIITANVGDSMTILCRNGSPVPISIQHRVWGVGDGIAEETARVEAAGGWISDGRVCDILAVSRAFGDWEFKGKGLPTLLTKGVSLGYFDAKFAAGVKFTGDPVIATPDIVQVLLQPEDEFLVIASDGLWESVPVLDAIRWARKEFQAGKKPNEVADSLAALALRRHTSDNVGVAVVDLKGAQHWAAAKSKSKGLFGGLFGG